ncbi:trypsin-like peptidase domain-containing protein [Silvibacterium acidisoli]|uniref:trypsin-like peptidase domain-containing protein n=1 Tax=Acidobacteriaceae bacterium ZG23-2 TaxID=2883246 RepID=UPI00406BFA25
MKSLLGRLRYRRLASTFTILATLSVGIIVGSAVAHGVSGQEAKVDSSDATPLKVPAPRDMSTDFTRIAKQVGPAVVNINTITLPKEKQQGRLRQLPGRRMAPQQQQPPDDQGGDDDDDDQDQGQGQGGQDFQDFFRHFFGGGPEGPDDQGQERESLGSGFIVDPRGYIITNNHVVDKADKIFVRLSTDPDGGNIQGRPAKLIGVDKETDIAVIKIDTTEPLPTVKLGNSDGAQVGDWVTAIGCPFNLSHTVTAGIISAKNRTIEPGTKGQFQHYIQTDAAINPGNSGGPLLNMAGEVIGINTAIYTSSGSYAGIGFAMPSNVVISTYNDLISPAHKVVRGSIGIQFQGALPSAVARVYGFKTGVLISSVQPGFAADKAGLKAGDIITTLDGRSVKDSDDLVADISARKPGSTVKVGYIRNGQHLDATVTIGDRSKMLAAAAANQGGDQDDNTSPEAPDAAKTKLGVTVSELPQGAPAGVHGVLIQAVKPGSFADEVGLAPGAVVVSVNRHQVHNIAEFQAAVSGLKSGDDVAFELVDPRAPKAGSQYLGGTLP